MKGALIFCLCFLLLHASELSAEFDLAENQISNSLDAEPKDEPEAAHQQHVEEKNEEHHDAESAHVVVDKSGHHDPHLQIKLVPNHHELHNKVTPEHHAREKERVRNVVINGIPIAYIGFVFVPLVTGSIAFVLLFLMFRHWNKADNSKMSALQIVLLAVVAVATVAVCLGLGLWLFLGPGTAAASAARSSIDRAGLNKELEDKAAKFVKIFGGDILLKPGKNACLAPKDCGGDGRYHHGVMFPEGRCGFSVATACCSGGLTTSDAHRGSDVLHESLHMYIYRLFIGGKALWLFATPRFRRNFFDERFNDCLTQLNGGTTLHYGKCSVADKALGKRLLAEFPPEKYPW